MAYRLEKRGHDEIHHEQGQENVEDEILILVLAAFAPEPKAPSVIRREVEGVHDLGDMLHPFIFFVARVDGEQLRKGTTVLALDFCRNLPDSKIRNLR